MRGIYVEARVRAGMDLLWELTQDPVRHARWDLRFGEIGYLEEAGDGPRRFRYALRLPGLTLAGVGVAAGDRRRPDGSRTSALTFSSSSALSPIRSGSGYWRYVPTDDGIRFLTGFRYEPGPQRRRLDALLVRPLIGWMTAWSFDRLRLWAEQGLDPADARDRALLVAGGRLLAAGAVAATRSRWSAPLAAAALLLPVPVEMPRARRCLRRPPDPVAARPPDVLRRVEAMPCAPVRGRHGGAA